MISSFVNLFLIHTFPKFNEMLKNVNFMFQAIPDSVSVYSRIVSFDEADNYFNNEYELRFDLLFNIS